VLPIGTDKIKSEKFFLILKEFLSPQHQF